MSDTAIRVFSPTEGLFREEIKSLDIRSREDARKVGPLYIKIILACLHNISYRTLNYNSL